MPPPYRRVPKAALDRRLHGRLATLAVDVRGWSQSQRRQLRDELVAWLSAHNLHFGGDFPVAVVYCPSGESTQSVWRALQRWLAAHLPGRHRLESAFDDMGISQLSRWAAMEAITGAQIALAETSQLCTWDLQQVALTLRPGRKSARVAQAAAPA